MKTIIYIALALSPALSWAGDKQPTVIVVPQQQAPAQRRSETSPQPNTSLAVVVQRLDDLSALEARRDSADQLLQQSLSADIAMMREKQANDDVRLDHLEAEATTIATVGSLAFTLLIAFAGWSASVAADRHKENRQTNQNIAQTLQHLTTCVAVMESKLGSGEHHT